MNCNCGGKTIVKDSREQTDSQWRRRYCNSCGLTFTTLEQQCQTLAGKKGKPRTVEPVLRKPKIRAQKLVKKAVEKVVEKIAAMPLERITHSRNRMDDIRRDKEYGSD